ncbi:hypothetical protein AVEN_185414-1 [Araneus ventricosus]|uniref:Uncharacterized protein n=1 Tax=Araneus ventricosus TaxID=182803 RepID=A0A4Y2CHV4_ARAVE|nr:hypothetical protein AVEN_185414-1 [Araneus ventricosus]
MAMANKKMVMPKKGNQQEKVHSIRDIQRGIGEMRYVLLAVYAFTGWDTVSAIYRKEKTVPFKKVQTNKALHTKLLRFNDPYADPNAVADAGKHFLLSMFGSRTPTIWILYATNVICRRSQNCLCIPYSSWLHSPPLAADKQHSCRAYHQVQQ